ncbi:MAG: hypothetical protein LQ348_006125, partial [Seirophora lacunosa]
MATPLDTVLNARITAMEYLARHFCQGAPVRLYGNFNATGRLSHNAQSFWALRETSSSCGRAYADRLTTVQRELRMFMTRPDLDALEDFLIRQKAAACERELREIKESLRALEGAENGNDALKVGKIYL